MLRNEQKQLLEEVEATRDLNANLKTLVNKSSIDAVDKANAERKQAIKDRDQGIKDAKSKAIHECYEAHEKQRKAESEAKEAKDTLARKTYLYFGLLIYTLLCCGVMNPQVRTDFISFFTTIITTVAEMLTTYIGWLSSFSDKMDWYWAWLLRILFSVAIVACLFGIGAGIIALYSKYKERWCTLSLKVLACTTATLTVFGEPIRRFIPINLILLFFMLQIGYLIVLWYFDGYFENRYQRDKWEQIQNQ